MDYFGVLKRAWEITWKHKALWVLGLFAISGSSGSGGGSSGYDAGGTGDFTRLPAQYSDWAERVQTWAQANLPVLIVIGMVLALVGLVFFVLSVAARGGLVHAVNEAEEGRPVVLRDAWSVGFRHWGRTFMIGLIAMLPVAVVAVLLIGLAVAFSLMAFVSGGTAAGLSSGRFSDSLGAGGTLLCCGAPLLLLALLVLGVVLSIVMELAIRYGVLYETTFGKAFVQGWRDLWAKRGAFVMWLVLLLPGIAYAIILGMIALMTVIPAIMLVRGNAVLGAIVILGAVFVFLLVPTSIYGTFVSASWTVFFRRMTGLEETPVSQRYMYPGSEGYAPPPAPPTAPGAYAPAAPDWQPPAPPMPPASVPPAPPAPEPPASVPPPSPTPDA